MKPLIHIEEALRVDDLRAGFLEHSRAAYARIPALDRPRILDIGCGSGLPTIELARLSAGEVVGIDTDEVALTRLRERADEARLSHRVKALNASLYETGFPEASFDLLWEEGVLHLLDPSESFTACRRLLKSGGFLVMGETISWFEGIQGRLRAFDFRLVEQYLLPRNCWWTEYYLPLEARIQALRRDHGDTVDPAVLARYEREVSMVRADPERFDCGFFILRNERATIAR